MSVEVFELDMEQQFIFGSDFCTKFGVHVDFSNSTLSFTLDGTTVTTMLVKEQIDVEMDMLSSLINSDFSGYI